MSSTAEETQKDEVEGETPQQEEATEPKAEGAEPQAEDAEPKFEEPQTEGAAEAQPEEQQQQQQQQEKEEEEEEEEEEPDDGVPRVLVTGASGYIALHVTKRLLEDGRFRVRGSVRNKKNKEKIQPLLNLVPDAKYPLRLVQADLQKPESWKKAVKSCSYVFHLASPFPPPDKPQTDEVLTPQAVEGTLSVLRACVEAGTVKRVVLTSSIAAISTGNMGNPGKPNDYLYSEMDWSDEPTCQPYERSKLRAERAAWDFMQKLDEDKRFELVVVNPGYVQGPLLSPSGGDGTKAMAVTLMGSKSPVGVPEVYFPVVDVRDVASAQVAALEKPEAAGNRYALVTTTLAMREAAVIMAEEFKPQGYKVTTMALPKPVLWAAKFFSSEAKNLYPYVGKAVRYNNEKMVGELGVTPAYTMKQTVLDTCYSLIELGVLPKARGYLGHPSTRPPPPAKEPKPESTPVDKEEPKEEPAAESTPADKEETKEEPKEEPAAESTPADEEMKEEPTATQEEAPSAAQEQEQEQPSESPSDDKQEQEPAPASPEKEAAEEESEKQEQTDE